MALYMAKMTKRRPKKYVWTQFQTMLLGPEGNSGGQPHGVQKEILLRYSMKLRDSDRPPGLQLDIRQASEAGWRNI
jgi:hypothetical protein